MFKSKKPSVLLRAYASNLRILFCCMESGLFVWHKSWQQWRNQGWKVGGSYIYTRGMYEDSFPFFLPSLLALLSLFAFGAYRLCTHCLSASIPLPLKSRSFLSSSAFCHSNNKRLLIDWLVVYIINGYFIFYSLWTGRRMSSYTRRAYRKKWKSQKLEGTKCHCYPGFPNLEGMRMSHGMVAPMVGNLQCVELACKYCSFPYWRLLGPFYGAIAVPSVTRCRCRRRCCGHRCAGGVRQWRRATVATPGEWACSG